MNTDTGNATNVGSRWASTFGNSSEDLFMLFKKGDPVKIVHRFKENPSHTGLRPATSRKDRYVAHVQ